MNAPLFKLCTMILAFTVAPIVQSESKPESKSELISKAESAAPDAISKKATILFRGDVLRKGSNGWVCLPETLPDDNAPMCNDEVWMKMMQAMGKQAAFKTDKIGLSYMLQGDGGVSNSNPYHANHSQAKDFIKEGPHLMLIVPAAQLIGMSDDHTTGTPYVMWKDTPYAHIMIPIKDRE